MRPGPNERGIRMRSSPPIDAPFTYFGKTWAVGENGRRVVSPRGPDLLRCQMSPAFLSERGPRGNLGRSDFPARPGRLVSKETDAGYRAPRGTNLSRRNVARPVLLDWVLNPILLLAPAIILENYVIFLFSSNLHHFLLHPHSRLMISLPISLRKS